MNKDMDEFIGKIFGTWQILNLVKNNNEEPIYQCLCKKCNFTHVITKTNIISKIICPTCIPVQQNKSPISDVVNLFGGLLGIDDNKKREIDTAFEKLNEPEFKEVYSSLERASKSIKDVMSGTSGAPDIARKILEVEAANLKKAFGGLIDDGKITEEEARILKTEINSSANIKKLKSVLEIMKQQQRGSEKSKI